MRFNGAITSWANFAGLIQHRLGDAAFEFRRQPVAHQPVKARDMAEGGEMSSTGARYS